MLNTIYKNTAGIPIVERLDAFSLDQGQDKNASSSSTPLPRPRPLVGVGLKGECYTTGISGSQVQESQTWESGLSPGAGRLVVVGSPSGLLQVQSDLH